MADVKRNPGKAGATQPGASEVQDINDTITSAIGARVKLTTVAPHSQTLQGTLYTVCPVRNAVALNTAPAPPNPSSTLANHPGNYHIIPIRHIQSFELISLDADAAKQPVGTIDMKKLRDREEAAIRKLQEQEANKGKGVTREAQQIFDALKRLLPTRWHEQQIVVSDSVIISPPYTANDCEAPKGKDQALDRIRMILNGERDKIARRAAQEGTSPAGNPRKGG
ncbi:hypothetical protein AUEXF2481DRAFT_1266 [Aureobasidium subglaciale EXF-2481]|uniref:AD domain-containing protein n=1 Tax=Aureobasidium subglaciale (strain EXF-2481) TaxID=1043005 RepID=A0A074YUE4_AURSE|nr:uncharacterized protein AUEXF2481DRAFT_1266 [Aureobasidium subglaciale EXF-2481]KEQ99784.1 hypothetical protein AUEXF2481DRAFT_1266 [Aureobasidium subglaciale EXF-2481]